MKRVFTGVLLSMLLLQILFVFTGCSSEEVVKYEPAYLLQTTRQINYENGTWDVTTTYEYNTKKHIMYTKQYLTGVDGEENTPMYGNNYNYKYVVTDGRISEQTRTDGMQKMVWTYIDGKFAKGEEYRYSPKGEPVSYTVKTGNEYGIVEHATVTEYNENKTDVIEIDSPFEFREFNETGYPTKAEYTITGTGKAIYPDGREEEVDGARAEDIKVFWEWDEDGNLLVEQKETSQGINKIIKEYDEHGNVTYSEKYVAGKLIEEVWYTYILVED